MIHLSCTARFTAWALSAGLSVATAFPGAAHADTFNVTVGAAGAQSANTTALCAALGTGVCTIGVETFTGRSSGNFTTAFGTGGVITGTYNGVSIQAADVYGGAGGTGSYAAATGSNPYTLSLSTTLPTGINYFGFWLSALDSGNDLAFYNGTTQVFSFTPANLIAMLGGCGTLSENAYCGNPNSKTSGDTGELFAFVNFFDTSGTFNKVSFSEAPAVGGYESDNDTVGFVTAQTGSAVPVPEPVSVSFFAAGLAGLILGRRRRV